MIRFLLLLFLLLPVSAFSLPPDSKTWDFQTVSTINGLTPSTIDGLDFSAVGAALETFGLTTVGGTLLSNSAPYSRASDVVLTSAQDITHGYIYTGRTGAGTVTLVISIFDNTGTLVDCSNTLDFTAEAAQWHELTFASPVSLASGTYKIVMGVTGANATYYYDEPGSGTYYFSNAAGTCSATDVATSSSSRQASFFISTGAWTSP